MVIDPNVLNGLQNIAWNVVADALESLLAVSSRKIGELIAGKKFLEKQERTETACQPILQKAIEDVAEYGNWQASKGAEIVGAFLRTSEVEEIVRQIYATRLTGAKSAAHLASIRQIFTALLIKFVDTYPSQYTPEAPQLLGAADLLFRDLLNACNLLLDDAIDRGILAAHEAKDALRYNILSCQLEAIQKELALLTAPQQMERQAILEFEQRYREQVGQRHGRIAPPNLNLEAALRLPINDLYVYPSFVALSKKGDTAESLKRDGQPEILKKGEFLSRAYRAVLLGDPGAGKSTLSQKLCYDLACHYSQRLFAGRMELTPILVILRRYGTDKKERKCSILQFIEAEARATYQLSTLPPNAFQYLLLTGRAAVIFDGLDELLDTSDRQEIRNDVESFCHFYPSVPVLVTSREVGYEQAPLDDEMFEVFRLNEFDDDQIKEYVKKWFSVNEQDLSPKQRQAKANAFLKESKLVPDLRKNPLMLALLCSIYREENYIPRNRPDVYEKCSYMLFERWDKSRKLYGPPLPEEYVKPLMEHLARWIYQDKQLQAGVTEQDLVAEAVNYLHPQIYEDSYKAEHTARKFVEFCTGRAWVFTDTGTRREGEKLYQFVHRTFLEYFTAAHIVHTCDTSKDLLKILRPKIAKREWDVVAQLAFQIRNKNRVGAGDELLTALLNRSAKSTEIRGWNLLLFAVRCLQFLVPHPEIRRSITKACIERCMAYGLARMGEKQTANVTKEIDEVSYELLRNIYVVAAENEATIKQYLKDLFIEYIYGDQDAPVLVALDILLFRSTRNYDITDEVYTICSARLERFYAKSLLLCCYSVREGKMSIADFIKWRGVKDIFASYKFIVSKGCSEWSVYYWLTLYIFDMPWTREKKDIFDNLRQFGSIVSKDVLYLSKKIMYIIELGQML